ncbi:SPOR domain-containing protein [Oceanicoccus sp. KOV_DT_Chl]|uniref:SPOR domain-containing protein n=1 Tax=Oceanicoccus sp. KOV_DT_Chl TaxID=1904639 RepID=UPI001F32FCD0|nr:SPOR domain-containing protein [Oceanicoccus sp. KOV_DT_Chl]
MLKTQARYPQEKATPQSQVPGWVWLFTGIVTGLFISFLAYLADITPTPAPGNVTAKVEEVKQEAKKLTTKFDFYTLLPEREVIVASEDDEAEFIEKQKSLIYILQAGSFKKAADADRLRAKLILMGLDANVDEVANANGNWHRVQVGPFTDRSKLAKARNTLISQGIDTLLLKRKAEG